MNLFMISLGGKAAHSTIEIHDVKFVLANNLEDCIEVLKKSWDGVVAHLHLDTYLKVQAITGYDVVISEQPLTTSKRLYFVCLGGYDENNFSELHKLALVGAKDLASAKQQAYQQLELDAKKWHLDEINEVEKIVLNTSNQKCFINLIENHQKIALKPDWYGYYRIDKL